MTKKAYYRAHIIFGILPTLACVGAALYGWHWRLMLVVAVFWLVDIAIAIEAYKRSK